MTDLLTRLARIVRSRLPRFTQTTATREQKGNRENDRLSGSRNTEHSGGSKTAASRSNSGGGNTSQAGDEGEQSYADFPPQVVEDLAVFELEPPGSLEEVREARNREIKKYHSDRFLQDPEKLETSKQIMQIYNAAYDRLKEHYSKNQK